MNNQLDAKLSITQLDYQSNSVIDFFSAIANQPWAMLLNSSAKNHIDNRYDILVADPIATLQTHGAITTINVIGKQPVTSEACPFQLLDHYQERLIPHHSPIENLPFIGGALGYFSYDLGRRVESIPNTAQQDILSADMAIGIYNWALVADNKTSTLHLIQPKGGDRQHWLQQFIAIKEVDTAFSLTSDWKSNMTESEYAKKFDVIQRYLESGDCYQINLAQRFEAQYQGSEWEAYQKLAAQNGAPFSAYIKTPEITILSVSPERFLQVKDRKIETKPIKGTRPRSNSPEIDRQEAETLRNSPKDRSET